MRGIKQRDNIVVHLHLFGPDNLIVLDVVAIDRVAGVI